MKYIMNKMRGEIGTIQMILIALGLAGSAVAYTNLSVRDLQLKDTEFTTKITEVKTKSDKYERDIELLNKKVDTLNENVAAIGAVLGAKVKK